MRFYCLLLLSAACLTGFIGCKQQPIQSNSSSKVHPVQEAFVEYGAVQCGFCTPGMILSAVHLLRQNPSPTGEEIREGLSGNLCRCTGYAKIREAVEAAARRMEEEETP